MAVVRRARWSDDLRGAWRLRAGDRLCAAGAAERDPAGDRLLAAAGAAVLDLAGDAVRARAGAALSVGNAGGLGRWRDPAVIARSPETA